MSNAWEAPWTKDGFTNRKVVNLLIVSLLVRPLPISIIGKDSTKVYNLVGEWIAHGLAGFARSSKPNQPSSGSFSYQPP
jgi:hypothetical protein